MLSLSLLALGFPTSHHRERVDAKFKRSRLQLSLHLNGDFHLNGATNHIRKIIEFARLAWPEKTMMLMTRDK